MIFVKTIKGYEDKTGDLDKMTNDWIVQHKVQVVSIQTALSHEYEGRANSGDLLYTIVYKADQPVAE